MSLLDRVRGLLGRRPTESDVPVDTATARTRGKGGAPDHDTPDRNSTTGTTPNEGFVGRVAADEPDDQQASGAERRAEAEGHDPGTGSPH